MRIRAFEWADCRRAQALLDAVQSFHARQRPDIYKPVHRFSHQKYYAPLLHQPELLSAVAEEDDAMAGICLVSLEEPQEGHPLLMPRRIAAVVVLCVAPEFRRRGVAEDLMNYVKVRAKALELDGLNLSVAAFNAPARALYEKLGFTTKSEKLEWNMK